MKRSTLPRNIPPPPLPKKTHVPEPDYEVIEFSGQYSNAPPKPPSGPKKPTGIKCELCGALNAIVRCTQCMSHAFCANCDDMYHRHPKRICHLRKPIETIEQCDKPPLPPKGETLNAAAPKPPPRRSKSRLMAASPVPSPSPNLSQRSGTSGRSDMNQVIKPGATLPNWVNFKGKSSTLNRPLPAPPSGNQNQVPAPMEPALRTSVFDTIKRPPSVTMEKIKTSTAAALDRMVQLQQRYRQHQETMRDDVSRRSSNSDRLQIPGNASLNGSMSSGIDSLPYRPPPPRPSNSVFNVSQPVPQRPVPSNPWGQPMMQAQSMAQLNFMGHPGAWHPAAAQQMWMNHQINRSNMSLNVPNQGFAMEDPWNQGWGSVYPFPMYPGPNIPVRPPSRQSRPARAVSPALSTRSRRSVTSQRRAPPAPRDVTDDEDSDEDSHDRFKKHREFASRRGRKMSVQSNFEMPLDDDKASISERRGRFTKNSAKSYRGGSVARSLHEYPVTSRRERTSPDSVPSSDGDGTMKRKKEPEKSEMAVQTYGEIGVPVAPVEKEKSPVKAAVTSGNGDIVHEMNKSWECKHCTYINDPGTRICGVCCKTADPLLTATPSPSPEFKRKPGDFNFDALVNEVPDLTKTKTEDDNQSVNSDKIEREILEKIEAFTTNKMNSLKLHMGTSPPPQFEELPLTPKIAIETERKTTGTSPPPQSISTQTYEPVVFNEQDTPKLLPQQLSPNTLRRSQSVSLANSLVQSQSSKSPRDLSPLSFHHERINSAAMDLQDLYHLNQSGQMLNKTYKSVSDLNYNNDNHWNLRSPSITDSTLRMDISQMMIDRSLTSLTGMKDLARESELKRNSGPEMINLLRQAEMHKYTTEELQAALSHCGDSNPISWLRDNWSRLIETVQTLSTKYGHRRPENTVGTISSIEAREALRLHRGDVWQAVTECIQQRQRKYNEIAVKGHFSREDIVTSLTAHHGNVELALIELSKSQLKPFMMNIWGPPAEIENESGNIIEGGSIHDLPHLIPNSDVMIDLMLEEMEKKMNIDEQEQQSELIGIDSTEMIQSSFKRAVEIQSTILQEKPQEIEENLLNDLKAAVSSEDLNSSIASSHSNGNLLRDIESLIHNLEENQSKKNEDLMKNIEGLFSTLLQKELKQVPVDLPYQLSRKSPIPVRNDQKDFLFIAMEENPTETSINDTSSMSQYSEALDESEMEPQQETSAEEIQNWLDNAMQKDFEIPAQLRRQESEKEDSPIVIPTATDLDNNAINFFNFDSLDKLVIRHEEQIVKEDFATPEVEELEEEHVLNQIREYKTPEIEDLNQSSMTNQIQEDHTATEDEELDQPNQLQEDHTTLEDEIKMQNHIMSEVDEEKNPETSENHLEVAISGDVVETPETIDEIQIETRENIQEVTVDVASNQHQTETETEELTATPQVAQEDNPNQKKKKKKVAKKVPKETDNWFFYPVNRGSYVRNVSRYYKKALKQKRHNELQMRRESLLRAQQLSDDTQPHPIPEVIVTHETIESPIPTTTSHSVVTDTSERESSTSPLRDILNKVIVDNVQKIDALDKAVTSFNGMSSASTPSALEPSKHLSDMVENTQRLIKQMKEEINSDIATFNSGESEEEYTSSEWTQEWSEEVTGDEVDPEQYGSAESIVSLFTDDDEQHHVEPVVVIETVEAQEKEIEPIEVEETSELEEFVAEIASAFEIEVETAELVTPRVEIIVVEEGEHESARSTISKSPDPERKLSAESSDNTETRKKPLKKKPSMTKTDVRKKSLPGPFGSLSSSNVRNIQEKLEMNNYITTKPLKPSKLVPPKIVAGSSVVSLAKKLNTKVETSKPNPRPGPSTSKIPVFQLPKKKYMETCFSDDYQTSEDEEELPKVPQRQIRKLVSMESIERKQSTAASLKKDAEELIEEGTVENYLQAELVAYLISCNFEKEASIWAASTSATLEEALALLQDDCELCMEQYPMNEMVSMLKCTHKCCKYCAKHYFTIQITERSIGDCTCPYCKIPDMHDPDVHEDEVLEYFSNLDIVLKNILEPECHELFQRKLRDRVLMQDPNFKWCVQCSSGCFVRKGQRRVICPDCGSITCSQCRKPWEPQHDGLTCEQFTEWKEANDPEKAAEGIAKHLQINGIDCPKCKFKYSLARGGCMHFTCTQCKHEFCYGCGKPFKMGAKCKVSLYCAKLGLHSHHPRNCLFYLRDKEPYDLQSLLKMYDVKFETESIETLEGDGSKNPALCPIPLQKETPTGMEDTICKGDVAHGNAGLCKKHYIEYLCELIWKNKLETIPILTADDLETIVRRAAKKMPPRPYGVLEGIYRQFLIEAKIDPLPIFDLTDCVQELRRRGIPLPERGPWDTDPIYREMCQKIVQAQIPLN